jgi:hypothetical protein
MATINIGMILFYVFSTNSTYWYLIAITAISHFFTVILLLLLAWIDPGIIPKIMSTYEQPAFKNIPISPGYLDNSVS